ncbi:MAG: hypothetical protein OEP48_01390 [Betaproteobacteria bacterium]|nr:hypothetical protein [Betaproteobacteria bacterium]MDH3436926.1 hypothetical protein [Betaproteobacteria bacterium]
MAELGPSNQASPLASGVAIAKDAFALLRDFALFAVAILLLVFPATFNSILTKAGFEEGSFAGLKWKANLLQADDALKNAQSTITDLRAQLDKTTQALGEARARTDDQTIKASIRKLEEENRQATAASTQAAAAVRSTIASNAPLVEKAQSALSTSGGWGVVFGSDTSVAAAQDEIARASKKGIPAAEIYLRNGYYASIAVVDNRTTAQEYLVIARTFRPDAYIASMATWCRNQQSRDGFVECQSRQ